MYVRRWANNDFKNPSSGKVIIITHFIFQYTYFGSDHFQLVGIQTSHLHVLHVLHI